jgi:hypothetical protein
VSDARELIEVDTGPAIRHSGAGALAGELLGGLGTRLAHSAAVARRVELVRPLLEEPWRSAIVDAAWLHDVGYGDRLVVTGFHALDGARWLRDHGWPADVCAVVAWHTASLEEAKLLGLDQDLRSEFDRPSALAAAALAWADLTCSPSGERCSVERRIADILARYPAESVVHCAMLAASSDLERAVREIESRLDLAGGDR